MKNIICLGLIGRAGTLHYASNLVSSLAKYAKVSLLLPIYSETKNISKKVKLIRITAPSNALKTILLTFNIPMHIKAIKTINKINPDLINILDVHPWYLLYWPFLKAKKKIVTINDPKVHPREEKNLWKFISGQIAILLMKKADEIIVLGEKQRKTVRRLGYKQRIIVSRIGHYDFFKKEKIRKHKIEPATLLFFGRIQEYKGIKYLLDSLLQIKSHKFKLILAGEGNYKPYEEQLIKLKGKVEVDKGYVIDKKVSEYFQRASFVVMPYTDATQTGIIQIAYSYKKPVIATAVGSLPELVIDDKTGYLIPSKDSKKLKEAIMKLLKNPEKAKQMGERAHKFMKEELDWNKIAKKLYSDLSKSP